MGSLLSSDSKGTEGDVLASGAKSRPEQPALEGSAAVDLANSSSLLSTKTLNSFADSTTTYVTSDVGSSPTPNATMPPPLRTLQEQTHYPNDLLEHLPSITYNTTLVNNDPYSSTTSNATSATTTSSFADKDFTFTLFGTSVYPLKWLTLPNLYSWLSPLSSLAMIIGCVLPYVPQYMTIYRNRNCSGFSTFVCLTLLIANILRVAFWFGVFFELPLLIQSVIMILTQLLLLELCIRVKKKNDGSIVNKRHIFTSSVRFFWRWTNLVSYLVFLCSFSALLGIAVYFLRDNKPFIQTLGYFALVIESMLALPQVIRNYKNSSVEGMSISMVLMWLAGDAFKTGYFILNNVPFQFWLCGLTQITIDLVILIQVCIYKRGPKTRIKTICMRIM